jgi:hypothetical protein
MIKSSWELNIDKCPHCNGDISIHYISTISERHLMDMVFKDINYHLGNECIDSKPKVNKVEIETESISETSAVRLYKSESTKVVF